MQWQSCIGLEPFVTRQRPLFGSAATTLSLTKSAICMLYGEDSSVIIEGFPINKSVCNRRKTLAAVRKMVESMTDYITYGVPCAHSTLFQNLECLKLHIVFFNPKDSKPIILPRLTQLSVRLGSRDPTLTGGTRADTSLWSMGMVSCR